jgi:hypothetical protein
MKIIINEDGNLPQALPIKNGSILNYYLQDYVKIELFNGKRSAYCIHFMDFLIYLTKYLNEYDGKLFREMMPLSGEMFIAQPDKSQIGLSLIDIDDSCIKKIFLSSLEWRSIQKKMRDLLEKSLQSSEIYLDQLEDIGLITLSK